MRKPVCGMCIIEMKKVHIGVTVEFLAISVKGAYQQWQADVHECPSCGYRVIAHFAEQPSWEHFHGQEKMGHNPAYVVPEL